MITNGLGIVESNVMRSDVEERYHRVIDELGVRKRWYQPDSDLWYAAVVGAVDGVDGGEILARSQQLHRFLPPGHDLHLIRQTLATVAAARGLKVEGLVVAAHAASESFRAAIRSKRIRRVAGSVVAIGNESGFEVAGSRVVALYRAWNREHRLLTNALDLVLAAITDLAGFDSITGGERAEAAAGRLGNAGYKNEWEVARILAMEGSSGSTERFLRLAGELRGRRRKPLADRRHVIAIASLADYTPPELVDILSRRLEALRISRFRPDRRTALTLAALLTLGDSVPAEHPLHAAFHGFALREHYVHSYAEAISG
jgi:hypothetical protein